MSQNAVISGVFADLKTVKSRSTIQMVIELPIEHGERVVAMFGFPQPGAEIAVAVARLVAEPAAPAALPPDAEPAPEPPTPARERTPWDAVPLVQQAAMRCNEVGFQRWLKVESAAEAAEWVRDHCGVKSRSELDQDEEAGSKWRRLSGKYYDFTRYGDMR